MDLRGLASISSVLLLAACGGGPGGGGSAAGGTGGEAPVEGGGAGGALAEGGTGGALDPNAPRIDALVPDTGRAGTLVELRGERMRASREMLVLFRPGVSATIAGASQDGTSVRAYVPSGATSGTVALRLDGTNHAGPSFTVEEGAPVPRLDSVSPDYVMAGAGGARVRLRGWGFDATSRLLYDEEELELESSSGEELVVQLPEWRLVRPGRHFFRVENPPPGGGTTEAVPFQVSGSFNLVSARPTSSTAVELVFDQQPDREIARQRYLYHLECFT